MDNLEILKQNLDTAIDPNAGIGEILAQEHNDMVTEFISKQGKYVGSTFNAKANYNGVANAGDFFINGALNDTNGITIVTAQRTNDLNDFSIVLNTLGDGDVMHLKDFVGRSFYFIFKSYSEAQDNNRNTVYELQIVPFADNINYTYQPQEVRLCIVEFLKVGAGVKSLFEGVELNLFWNRRGKEQKPEDYCEILQRKKYVFNDPNTGAPFFKTIKTKVLHLGVEIKNFANLNPNTEIVIERYKRPRRNSFRDSKGSDISSYSPAGYRIQHPYNENITSDNIGNYVFRPMFFPVLGDLSYYRIYAENYFSQVDPPKALGNHLFMTFAKGSSVNIVDDADKGSRKVPVRRKGYAHCRLRLRTDVTGNRDYIYSDVMAYFKIIDQLVWDKRQDQSEVLISEIKYSYE